MHKTTHYLGFINSGLTVKLASLVLAFSFLLQPVSVVFAQEVTPMDPVVDPVTTPSTEEQTSIPTPEIIPEVLGESIATEKEEKLPKEEKLKEEKKPVDEQPLTMAAMASSQSSGVSFKVPTQAQATVDQSTGSLIYEYPISLPEGRAGMTPELSLKYNSRNASKPDGIAGLGWETSVPYIMREASKGTDNLYSKAFFSSSLSGNLIATTDTTSSAYTLYRPETDGGEYLKYTYNSNNTWTMVGKDGKTYTFGETSASRQDNPTDTTKVYKWMISKIADTKGNEIRYSYIKDSGQIYPSQILYTYHASSPAVNTVNFTYTTPLNYGSTVYTSAFPVTTYKLLNTVLVSTTVGAYTSTDTYKFNYADAQFLKQKTLTSIQKIYNFADSSFSQGFDGYTYFSYSTKTPGWQQGTHSLASYLNIVDDTIYKDVYTADFDKNGSPDVFISNKVGSVFYNYLMLNNGTNFTDSFSAWGLPAGVDYSMNYFIADLNGDKLPDLHPRNVNPGQTPPIYLNTGSGFTADTSGTWFMDNYITEVAGCGVNVGDSLSYYTNTFLYDMNNDGKNDLVYFGGATNFKVYLNNGSGWTQSSAYIFTIKPGSAYDFSKNCRSTNLDENFQTLLDVNGDGLLDYAHLKYGTYLNTGTGFAYSTPYTIDLTSIDRTGFADINNAALVDVVSFQSYSGSALCTRVFLNSGAGFTLANPTVFPPCTNSNVWDPVDFQWTDASSPRGTLLDLTADGYSDILAPSGNGGYVAGKLRAINDSRKAWIQNPNESDPWLPISPSYGFYFDVNTDGIVDFITPKTMWDGTPMLASKVYIGNSSVPNRLTKIRHKVQKRGAVLTIPFL